MSQWLTAGIAFSFGMAIGSFFIMPVFLAGWVISDTFHEYWEEKRGKRGIKRTPKVRT